MSNNEDILALFGEEPGLVTKKSDPAESLLNGLLFVNRAQKEKEQAKKLQEIKAKKKYEGEQEEDHYMLRIASKPIKKQRERTILFAPTASQKQQKYSSQISQAKRAYEMKSDKNTTEKKIYAPKVVNFFEEEYDTSTKKKQNLKNNERKKEKDNNHQRSSKLLQERHRSRQPQYSPKRQKHQDQKRQKYREKQSKDLRHERKQNHHKQQQKLRQRERQRQRQKQRQYQRKKEKHHKQKRHYDDFIVEEDDHMPKWKQELRKITKLDEKRQVYRERDRMEIQESTPGRMFAQDRISAKYGRMQEQEDMLREKEEEERQRRIRRQKEKQRERRR